MSEDNDDLARRLNELAAGEHAQEPMDIPEEAEPEMLPPARPAVPGKPLPRQPAAPPPRKAPSTPPQMNMRASIPSRPSAPGAPPPPRRANNPTAPPPPTKAHAHDTRLPPQPAFKPMIPGAKRNAPSADAPLPAAVKADKRKRIKVQSEPTDFKRTVIPPCLVLGLTLPLPVILATVWPESMFAAFGKLIGIAFAMLGGLLLAVAFLSMIQVAHERHRLRVVGGFAAALLLVIGVSCFAIFRHSSNPSISQTPATAPAVADLPSDRFVSTWNDEAAIRQALGLVVAGARFSDGKGKVAEEPISTGSCFAVSYAGYLVTNKHVVEEAYAWQKSADKREKFLKDKGISIDANIWVFFEGQKSVAEIVHVSDQFDLAILKIPTRPKAVFKLSSKLAARGDDVYAMGFPAMSRTPLSLEEQRQTLDRIDALATDVAKKFIAREFEYTLTKGNVSLISKEVDTTWVQHEATIRGGNSGGPLVTPAGRVAGINTLTVGDRAQINNALDIVQLRKEIDKYAWGAHWE